MQTQVQADCALQCLRHATCKGRFEGRLCEDVAQQQGFAIDISCTATGQGEEACSILQRRHTQPQRRAGPTSGR